MVVTLILTIDLHLVQPQFLCDRR